MISRGSNALARRIDAPIALDDRVTEGSAGEAPSIVVGPPRFVRGLLYGLALSVVLWGLLALIALAATSIAP
jgi:hypothetical protein